MLKSIPFIAILVAHTTHLYSMYTFIQLFPKYLGDVQGKSIKDIGFLASMPQALTVFLIIFGSNISDWLYGIGINTVQLIDLFVSEALTSLLMTHGL